MLKEKVDSYFLLLQIHTVSFVQAVLVTVQSSRPLILVTIVKVDKEEEAEVENLAELKRLKVLLGEAWKKVTNQSKAKDVKGKGKQG